ncbi:MAG: helix-turn-helix domain-containing protein, partial [Eubacterium sp.]|nr:helix-turn-helix domain-containing protein [Eubacterium sp.]
KAVLIMRQKMGCTRKDICEKTGLSEKGLMSIENPENCNPRLDSQIILSRGLGVQLSKIYEFTEYIYINKNESNEKLLKRAGAYMEELSCAKKEVQNADNNMVIDFVFAVLGMIFSNPYDGLSSENKERLLTFLKKIT